MEKWSLLARLSPEDRVFLKRNADAQAVFVARWLADLPATLRPASHTDAR
ncbi:hypothetical protein WNY61_16375 [Sulfitobacter sp. AS92]